MKKCDRKIITVMTMLLMIASIQTVLGVQIPQASPEVSATSLTGVNGDSPFLNAEAKFIVYPDGWVLMSGELEYTNLVTPYTGLEIDGVVEFTKSDELTLASTNFKATLPPEYAEEWPFNATNVDLHQEYSEGILNGGIDCIVTLPPSIASQSPFNVTDLVMLAEWSEGQISGTITVHLLSGLPLGDLELHFLGNRNIFSFEGSLKVIYGTYFDQTIDEMALRDMLWQLETTIPGQAAGSIYESTNGLFECTKLTTTMIPYNDVGATIDFEVEISGDIIDALAYIMSQEGRPPLYSMLYSSLEASFSSIESASLELSYAYTQKEASMRLTYVVDESALMKDVSTFFPETVPPEMKPFVEALLNTTYCSAKSYEVSLSYADGKADLRGTVAIEGDLNAELNYVKAILFNYAATTQQLTWQETFINQTKLDVSNFKMRLKLSETLMVNSLEGFGVSPPLDVINATSFKLERFFGLTEDMPFPGQGQRLKITIEGGSNATHGVILFRPETVPEPDTVEEPPGYPGINSMVWHNQTFSELEDLIFNIRVLDMTPPVADAGPEQTVNVETTVNFDAGDSTDNVDVVSFEWDFGDGTTGTGKTTTHTYKETGTYTVTLKVRDAAENTDTTSITVSVQTPPIWTQTWFLALIGVVVAVVFIAAAYIIRKKSSPASLPPAKTTK